MERTLQIGDLVYFLYCPHLGQMRVTDIQARKGDGALRAQVESVEGFHAHHCYPEELCWEMPKPMHPVAILEARYDGRIPAAELKAAYEQGASK